jgi:protein-L-isoaspartate(D-aspartate) O-methyltransferase
MDHYQPEAEDQQVFQMRQHLVEHLKQYGLIKSPMVEKAFQAVPRHVFLPGINVTRVYSDTVIATKTVNGIPISSSSQPAIMACMLEQLDVQPGQRILEIGAGTGYNAALLAHMVGNQGSVVTIDIDEDIVESARQHLQAAGYPQVNVICADGALGFAELAPYDRIILTVGADDIPPAWREQLVTGGKLVLPFKITQFHSILSFPLALDQLSLALQRVDNHLISYSMYAAGFMPLRGSFAIQQRKTLLLDKGLSFASNKAPSPITAQLLIQKYRDYPTGIQANAFELWSLHIWLLLQEPNYCEIQKKDTNQKYHNLPILGQQNDGTQASYGLFSHDSLSMLYRSIYKDLPTPDSLGNTQQAAAEGWEKEGELIVRSFGSDHTLAHHLIQLIRAWDQADRPFQWSFPQAISNLTIHAYPSDRIHTKGDHEILSLRKGSLLVFAW